MDSEALRALQSPLKAAYRADPAQALVTLRARGRLGPELTCEVDTHIGTVAAGLHPASGGTGEEACSGDMLLQALVGCAGVTLRAVSTAIGLEIRGGSVSAEGVLDFRGTLGVAKEAPVGFREIRLRFELDSPASDAELAKLLELTERYCVVFQTLRQANATSSSIARPARLGSDRK